jgi:hypothetical protein
MSKTIILMAITIAVLIIIIAVAWYILRTRADVPPPIAPPIAPIVPAAIIAVPTMTEVKDEMALFNSASAPTLYRPFGYFAFKYDAKDETVHVLLFENPAAKNTMLFMGFIIDMGCMPIVAIMNSEKRGYMVSGYNDNGTLINVGASLLYDNRGTPLVLAKFTEVPNPQKVIAAPLFSLINFNAPKIIDISRLGSVADLMAQGEIVSTTVYGHFALSTKVAYYKKERYLEVQNTNYANVFITIVGNTTIPPASPVKSAVVITKQGAAFIVESTGKLITANDYKRAPIIQPVSDVLGWSVDSAPRYLPRV